MPEQNDTPPPPKRVQPFPESLCWRCVHHREIEGARSTFVMCSALAAKYPPQPVRTCSAFREERS
jgi:hypothetical protein